MNYKCPVCGADVKADNNESDRLEFECECGCKYYHRTGDDEE